MPLESVVHAYATESKCEKWPKLCMIRLQVLSCVGSEILNGDLRWPVSFNFKKVFYHMYYYIMQWPKQ